MYRLIRTLHPKGETNGSPIEKSQSKETLILCYQRKYELTIFCMYGISIAAIREHHNGINWKKIIQVKAQRVIGRISRLKNWKKK